MSARDRTQVAKNPNREDVSIPVRAPESDEVEALGEILENVIASRRLDLAEANVYWADFLEALGDLES